MGRWSKVSAFLDHLEWGYSTQPVRIWNFPPEQEQRMITAEEARKRSDTSSADARIVKSIADLVARASSNGEYSVFYDVSNFTDDTISKLRSIFEEQQYTTCVMQDVRTKEGVTRNRKGITLEIIW
jgi:hypothetical protein